MMRRKEGEKREGEMGSEPSNTCNLQFESPPGGSGRTTAKAEGATTMKLPLRPRSEQVWPARKAPSSNSVGAEAPAAPDNGCYCPIYHGQHLA